MYHVLSKHKCLDPTNCRVITQVLEQYLTMQVYGLLTPSRFDSAAQYTLRKNAEFRE